MSQIPSQKHTQILIIGSIPPPYHGSTVAVQSLLNSRLREEFDLLHLDTSDHRNFENLGKFDFINVSLGLKNLLQLAFICIFNKPDIVHVSPGTNIGSCLREGLFVILTKILSRAKLVVHFHTGYFKKFYLKSGPCFKRFVDFFLGKTDRAIVLGECFRPMVGLWFPSQRVDVVPNGTSFDPYHGGPVGKSYHHRRPVCITYMSNIDPAKGVFTLLKALQRITKNTSPIQLTIAGAWTSSGLVIKEQIDGFIMRSQLGRAVRFAGVVKGKEKEDLLKETDIFVLPSTIDAQPYSIIEAMAAGCPVVSTWHAAIPETVIDSKTGLLVEKENVDQLARALKGLIENPELRKKLGLAGRKRYERCYTKEKNIENMILVFKRTLNSFTDK
jgi:glycosyltransferase involved in cell wall biosynthesis